MGSTKRTSSNAPLIKTAFTVAVILLCIGYVTWRFWPRGPVVVEETKDTYFQWNSAWGQVNNDHATKRDATYFALGKVSVTPTEDRSGVIVVGTVASQGELAAIKAAVAKVQPEMPVTWNVKVGE